MKRSFEDIRQILLELESLDESHQCEIDNDAPADEIAFGTVTSKSLAYHLPLLIDAGLLTGQSAHSMRKKFFHSISLTWAGHDFLDNIRTESVWKKVRSVIGNKEVQTASFSVWAAVAAEAVKRNVGLG